MKIKAVLLIVLTILSCIAFLTACTTGGVIITDGEGQGTDDDIFEEGKTPLDESFLYDIIGMDKTVSDAEVRLMPAPYDDKCLTIKGEVLSATADTDAISGQYILYYCVEEEGAFNVYKLTSQDGKNWDNDGNKQKYFTAEGVATVVAGAASVYVEKTDTVRIKSIDGSVNTFLGVDNAAFVNSAYYKDGAYYVYTSDSEGNTFVSIVKDGGVTVRKITDTAIYDNVQRKFVLSLDSYYLSFSKRCEDGICDFTASMSNDGMSFFSFNGAYINADASSSDNSQNGWTKCDKNIANGWCEVVNDNANQDTVAGVYSYEYRDGVTDFRLYKLRKSGIAAFYGDLDGATVWSKNIAVKIDKLVLDYQTGAAGYIDVEIKDSNGNTVFSAYAERGNRTNKTVILNKEAADALANGGKIKFTLYDAYLYRVYTEGGSL